MVKHLKWNSDKETVKVEERWWNSNGGTVRGNSNGGTVIVEEGWWNCSGGKGLEGRLWWKSQSRTVIVEQ